MKKNSIDKSLPIYMSYETYSYLISIIDNNMINLENEFRRACYFIPEEPYKHGKLSGIGKAHKIFAVEYSKLRQIKDELYTVAQATYKTHPNAEIRKFWCVEDIKER